MSIVNRVTGICLKPAAEWGVIAEEPASTGGLYTGYVIPLAAIGPIAGFVGGSIIGRSIPYVGTYRIPVGTGLTLALSGFVMTLVSVYVLALIINALAPKFAAEKNTGLALKVAVYAWTPAWIAGVLQLVTMLGLLGLAAAAYSIYLLYLGLPRLMKCPPERAMSYTVVVVLCGIGLAIAGALVSRAFAPSMGGAGLAGLGAGERPGGRIEFDKDSPLGKLQALGQAMEASGKKMEAAEKSGDRGAQTAAAMETLGTLMGGGKRVQPVAIDQLKPFIPETFAELAKKRSSAEKAGVAGLMISKAEASYGDGDKAGWAGVQGEKEDDNGFERTQTVEGRLVHEKGSKTGAGNEFTIILGQRFIVSAKGHGVELAELKKAVAGMDLGKLEGMKDLGVQK